MPEWSLHVNVVEIKYNTMFACWSSRCQHKIQLQKGNAAIPQNYHIKMWYIMDPIFYHINVDRFVINSLIRVHDHNRPVTWYHYTELFKPWRCDANRNSYAERWKDNKIKTGVLKLKAKSTIWFRKDWKCWLVFFGWPWTVSSFWQSMLVFLKSPCAHPALHFTVYHAFTVCDYSHTRAHFDLVKVFGVARFSTLEAKIHTVNSTKQHWYTAWNVHSFLLISIVMSHFGFSPTKDQKIQFYVVSWSSSSPHPHPFHSHSTHPPPVVVSILEKSNMAKDVVARDFTINLHKSLHSMYVFRWEEDAFVLRMHTHSLSLSLSSPSFDV